MKLSLHKARLYRKIRAKNIEKRKARKKAKQQTKAREASNHNPIPCPSALNLNEKKNRKNTLRFLGKIRTRLASAPAKIIIDFSNLRSIEAHAGILLRAELERIKRLYPQTTLKGINPRYQKTNAVLTQIQVNKFCSMRPCISKDHDVIHWRAVSGHDVDGETYAEELMKPYEERLPFELQGKMYIGVSEAMTNVSHHAYIDDRLDGLKQSKNKETQWWMFTQERDRQLTVIICDLGVGLPRTLPQGTKRELAGLRKWMAQKSRNEGDILSAVLKKTAAPRNPTLPTFSRTGEQHRGRGLYNIVHAVRDVPDGEIGILSNKGAWFKSKKAEKGMQISFRDSIKGTIISWSVPLS